MAAGREMTGRGSGTGDLPEMSLVLSSVGSRRAAFDILAAFAREMGFSDVLLTVEANPVTAKWGEMRWSTLDYGRLSMLDEIGFDGGDPLHRFARRSLDPFIWTASEWPDMAPRESRQIMDGLGRAGIHAGMSIAVWSRAGRIALIDAFGDPRSIRTLSPWSREAFHLAGGMTFRAIERASLVPGGAGLTRREIEVLDLVSQGLTIRSIAQRLDIVEPTVKFHLKSVRVKLDARNTSEAVARFVALEPSLGLSTGLGNEKPSDARELMKAVSI